MFGDIGWTELLLIGIVALIVIGPEDLPEMFRQLGRFTAKLRSMSREFSRAMEQAAKESGVKDVAKDINTIASPKNLGLNAVKDAADKFEKWDPLKATKAASTAKAAGATPVLAAAGAAPSAAAVAAAPEVAATEGPATQALREKQTQRKAILREAAGKLKAVDGAEAAPVGAPTPGAKAAKPVAETATAPKAQAKPRMAKVVDEAAKPAPKPRKKKADEV